MFCSVSRFLELNTKGFSGALAAPIGSASIAIHTSCRFEASPPHTTFAVLPEDWLYVSEAITTIFAGQFLEIAEDWKVLILLLDISKI
jgi:hypothetical protein